MTREHLIGRDGGICMWCRREPWTADLSAEHLLPRALERLTRSESSAHAEYARRQLVLLGRT
jgi:hypothetical protein